MQRTVITGAGESPQGRVKPDSLKWQLYSRIRDG